MTSPTNGLHAISKLSRSESVPTFIGTAQIYLSPTNGSKPFSVEDLNASFSKSPLKVNTIL